MGTYGPTWILKDVTYCGTHHYLIQVEDKKYFCVWVDHLIFYILTTITKWFVQNLYILKFDNKSRVIYYNWKLSNWSSIMWKLSKIIFIAQWRNSKVLVNLAIYYLCKLKEYWNYFFILPPYLLKCGIGAMQLLYINIWDLFTRWACLSILKQGSFLLQKFCIISLKNKNNSWETREMVNLKVIIQVFMNSHYIN